MSAIKKINLTYPTVTHGCSVLKVKHEVGTCYRCHTVIEPMVSKQWFVSMKPLAKPAIEAVTSGATQFLPERFSKQYMNWMTNIRDWCISRQLWWGHSAEENQVSSTSSSWLIFLEPHLEQQQGSSRRTIISPQSSQYHTGMRWPHHS